MYNSYEEQLRSVDADIGKQRNMAIAISDNFEEEQLPFHHVNNPI